LGSMGSEPKVVLDTNIFVAAGFNPHSASARIIEEVRAGRLSLVWSEDTRRESRAVVEQIPPLSWDRFADLFGEAGHYSGRVNPESVDHVLDPDDRKFAALAGAVDAVLVTNDDDLLGTQEGRDVLILTPDEFLERR